MTTDEVVNIVNSQVNCGTPNVILIISDHHRWDYLGCAGANFIHTPNLDRLATKGTVLNQMYSTSPVCMPQRITLTTGRYAMNTGCYGNMQPLPDPKCPSFVRQLRQSGVNTAMIGKFHNHQHYEDADFIAHQDQVHQLGYETVCETAGKVNVGHHRVRCRFMEFLHSVGIYDEYKTWVKQELVDYHPNMPSNPWQWDPDTTQDAFIAQRAVTFIENVRRERPFYLHIGFVEPHPPFDAPECYRGYYRDVIPPPPAGRNKTRNAAWWRAYCSCITEIDTHIGRVMQALEACDLDKETVVLYTSDHGDYAGDLGYWSKGDFHEPSVHVPFLSTGPGIASGRSNGALAELIDVGATICSVMGIPTHDLDQGQSLLPLLQDKAEHHRSECYSEMGSHKMIFDGRYKLLFGSKKLPVPDNFPDHLISRGAPVLLYDLHNDPKEERNLSDTPRYQNKLANLKDRLLRRIIDNQQGQPSALVGKSFSLTSSR